MSNYRRLISYIYAYEGGVKGKNIGYAKIEIRGDQCRIQVNVKKVYVGSSEIGVYLLAPDAEILLGRIFIRNGAGEFRIQVKPENVEGSGSSMDRCYGLTIHDVDSAWQSYTTIWEDAVAQAAEIQLADVTAENIRKKASRELLTRELLAQELLPAGEDLSPAGEALSPAGGALSPAGEALSSAGEALPSERLSDREPAYQDFAREELARRLPVSEEIERELKREEERLETMAPWEEPEEEEKEKEKPDVAVESVAEPEQAGRVPEQPEQVPQPAELSQAEQVPQAERVSHPAEPPQPEQVPQPPQPISEPENLAKLEELDRLERENSARNNLWNRLQRHYTKVLAFDYDNGCEILSIKPQDIGLLPREIWVFGNNSFLLHGYFNYRHLILARLNNPQGAPRYLLGVPGHYFSNEKYMASMFGFPHFVLAKKQPEDDGRFGYWYTDIRL